MKNLLLNATVFMVAASACAQLYVQPNGTDESYVYVNDQILFVEQDVNLQPNPTGNFESSVYLRNDSQLIQGATASNNIGNGTLSVYQDSNSDSYDYNFWSAPVGFASGPAGNRSFGILRVNGITDDTDSYTTGITSAYNGSSTPLTISRRWLYRQTAAAGYQAIGTNNNVPAGYGFTMKGTDVTPAGGDIHTDAQNQNYDFRGRPHNGTITVPTGVGSPLLTGNPYPSALDLNRMFYDADNSEITEILYWDEDRSINSHLYVANKGGFGIWVPMGSDPNGTSQGMYTLPTFVAYDAAGNPLPIAPGDDTGLMYDRRFAPIGQGFVVVGAATSGGDVTANSISIKNSHRRYIKEGSNGSVFKSAENGPTLSDSGAVTGTGGGSTGSGSSDPATLPDDRIPHMRIFTMFGESHFRDMVLAFSDEATDGFDRGFDGKNPDPASGTDASFPIGEDADRDLYVIQTINYEIGKRVPIAFNIRQQTTLEVGTSEEVNKPYPAAYLWDSSNNTYQSISGDNVANLSLDAGNYDNRFYIVFRGLREATDSSDGTKAQEKAVASMDFFQDNRIGQLQVANPEGYDVGSANIYDMGGRLVLSKVNLGSSNSFTFPTGNLSDGVYLVKMLTKDNFAIDHKITVYNNN